MSSKLLMLLLPALASARININIQADPDSESTVDYFGSSEDIISDVEARSFGLTDSALKSAAERFSGGRPGDVYLKSPTPWNDLYKTYGWREIKRTLYPRDVRILGIRAEPVILATQNFINNSTVASTYSAIISQQVQDTVTSTWRIGETLTVGQEITYSVKVGVGKFGGTANIAYASSWGEDHSTSKTVTVGSSSGVKVELQPGQAAVASLSATRGNMEIQVDYTAHLDGDLACNYPRRFNGHHFWRYDINAVQTAGNLRKNVDSSEIIRIGFYSDAKVMISDGGTRSTLAAADVEILDDISPAVFLIKQQNM